MNLFVKISLLFALCLAISCRKALPELEGIDEISWKNDPDGCQGKRVAMAHALESQKEKLLALSEMEIVSVLGKPDQNELYSRNQKFYYYFIQPSRKCAGGLKEIAPTRLVIRFNAMGLAKDIRVETDQSP